MEQLNVASTSFRANQPIPKNYTADGDNLSPQISWTSFPKETKEFVLICDDPDVPRPEPWVHWVLYHISADTRFLPEAAAKGDRLKGVPGAVQGKNSWDTIGYRGPQPPPGKPHRYRFTIYALSEVPEIGPDADKTEVLKRIEGLVLATGEMIGTYRR